MVSVTILPLARPTFMRYLVVRAVVVDGVEHSGGVAAHLREVRLVEDEVQQLEFAAVVELGGPMATSGGLGGWSWRRWHSR